MRNLIIALLLVLGFVFETKVQVFGIRPSVTVLLVYFIGLRHGHLKGLGFGVLAGALSDAVAGTYLGPGLLGMATVGYLAQYLRKGMFIWTPVLGVIGLASLTAIDGLISYYSIVLFFEPPATIGHMAAFLFWQAAMNAPFGMFITPGEDNTDAES